MSKIRNCANNLVISGHYKIELWSVDNAEGCSIYRKLSLECQPASVLPVLEIPPAKLVLVGSSTTVIKSLMTLFYPYTNSEMPRHFLTVSSFPSVVK